MPPVEKPLIYLNNAATSWPKPPGILEAISLSLSLPVFGSGRTTGTQGEDHVMQARCELADLFHADDPQNIIFTHNATDSLNILI
ncbi:MAG: aminotransferase class V-fold PLP-dependent enzyme, partial [Methanocorpusculum parvum]|nr:aminotransferase class V-fold PLP-dependent enzyme [Methanocorpusculum parvum]